MAEVISAPRSYQRVAELAKPKPLPAGFIEHKRSVYSESKIVKDKPAPTKFILTPRLDQLCQPKPYHASFAQDRPTPIWAVSGGAKQAEASAVTENLSKPKSIHKDWVEGRPIQTVVKKGALQAEPSDRLKALATSKNYKQLPIREGTEWDFSDWTSEISPAALKAVAPPRLEALAQEKSTHSSYLPPCPVQSIVNPKTLKASASSHVTQLARPKDRKELEENPNVWKVTPVAKLAQASPRTQELCAPLARKQRTKKNA